MNNTEKLAAGQLLKQAGPRADLLTHALYGMATLAAPPVGLAYTGGPLLSAAGTPTWTEEDLERNNEEGDKSIIPGVGAHRSYKRLGMTMRGERAGPKAKGNAISEILSMLTVPTLGAGLGALAGATLTGGGRRVPDIGMGAVIGGGLGLLSLAGGDVAGLLAEDARTKEEQQKQDSKSNVLRNLLTPGRGTYQSVQRLRSTGKEANMNNTEKLAAANALAMLSATPAFGALGAAGGALGGYRGPDDSAGKLEGQFRGGAIGAGSGIGAGLGAVAGAALSSDSDSKLLKALAMLLGAGAGGVVGGKGVQAVLGEPGEQARKKDEDR